MNTQLYQILPGRPFGRARHGTNVTLNSDPTTRRRFNGSSGATTGSLDSAGFSNGDLVLIMQVHGNLTLSTEENYEVNIIISGGGTSSLTFQNPLGRSYVSSGSSVQQGYVTRADQAAVIQTIMEYENVTINFTPSNWDGLTGGLFAWADIGVTKGSMTFNGAQGSVAGDTGGMNLGGGFRGGWTSTDASASGDGEGWKDVYPTESNTGATDNGASGHQGQGNGNGSGHGGGNATAGENNGQGGYEGQPAGSTDLKSFMYAGAGSGAKGFGSEPAGCNGGGNLIGWCKYFQPSGNFTLDGGQASGVGSEGNVCGGAGAGGNFQLNTQDAINLQNILCRGGARSSAGFSPGSQTNAGGAGRVRVNYGYTATGTPNCADGRGNNSNPSIVVDPNLYERRAGAFCM